MGPPVRAWLAAFAAWAVAVVLVILFALVTGGFDHSDIPTDPEAVRRHRPDQCEPIARDGWFAEPQNTWSNLAYLLAGIVILFRAFDGPPSIRLLAAAVGGHLAGLAVFSGLYHASLGSLAQSLDVAWVYCALLAMIVFGIHAIVLNFDGRGVPVAGRWVLFGVTSVIGLLLGFMRGTFDSTIVFIVLVVLMAGLAIGAIIQQKGRSDLVAALVLASAFAGGSFVFRLGDGGNHFLCKPEWALQPHAIWHTGGAVSLLFVYNFFAQVAGDGMVFQWHRP
jgi:hypothetical protein